ncbi:MAG: hypothetical protein PHC62_00105 [Candidatus Izemoplasmatales bacterium]|nr:hypothetical protein [Candidatus Izemoplasmatales bacterium]
MKEMTQAQFIRQMNEKTREKFNDSLFERTDQDTINEIEKVVRSCERNNKYYTIKVHDFYTIRDYDEIYHRMKTHELNRIKSNNQKIRNEIEDRYDTIQLKDSDIFLIVVVYHLRINTIDELTGKYPEKYLEVLIQVPKIVDKYYIRVFGNHYLAIYQIVDGSTYNNSQSTSKHPNVTLKTMFMATRIYRYADTIRPLKSCGSVEPISILYYDSRIFGKQVPVMKYLLAKYGYTDATTKLKIQTILINDYDIENPDYLTFKRHNVFVSVPKYIFANDVATQSMVYTIFHSIEKSTTSAEMHTQDFWLRSLGANFNSDTVEKGLEILDSLECIYDISTKESIHLPEEDKQDIFHVFIWIVREFPNLRGKDNLDLSTKRIRLPEYQSAIYGMKIARNIIRTGNIGKSIQITDLEKAVYTQPDFLIKKITKDSLINYRNSVNDLDSMNAIKWTYKGVSGLGDGSSIPDSYRKVDKSYIGRLDMDAAPSTDPGMSGTLCPLADIQNHSFSEFSEPNNWREETEQMMQDYMSLRGLKELITFQKELDMPVEEEKETHLDESINAMKKLFRPIYFIEEGK